MSPWLIDLALVDMDTSKTRLWQDYRYLNPAKTCATRLESDEKNLKNLATTIYKQISKKHVDFCDWKGF